MAHNRKFADSIVMGVMGKLRNTRETLFVQDEMERIIIASGILDHEIFKWVGLTYRIENETRTVRPYTWKVDPKDGELPLAIVLDFDVMKWTDLYNVQLMKDIFMAAALDAMIFVAKKYKYPPDYFVDERAKYGPIPETVEECERLHNDHPEQHLIDISKSQFPTQIITAFDEILNHEDSFQRLKSYMHKLPAGLLETTILKYQEAYQAGTLSGYEFHDPQDHSAKCAELLSLLKK